MRWNENARCQSTDPDSIGANADVKASSADADPMATATRPAQTTPQQVDRHKEQDDGAGQRVIRERPAGTIA